MSSGREYKPVVGSYEHGNERHFFFYIFTAV
jgi:hypothetical protein